MIGKEGVNDISITVLYGNSLNRNELNKLLNRTFNTYWVYPENMKTSDVAINKVINNFKYFTKADHDPQTVAYATGNTAVLRTIAICATAYGINCEYYRLNSNAISITKIDDLYDFIISEDRLADKIKLKHLQMMVNKNATFDPIAYFRKG